MAMNEPCCVFVGLWMIVGRDESAPTSTVCSLLYIYALNEPCGVFVGLWNDVRARWICPYALRSVRWYIFCAINKFYGIFAEYYTLQVLRYLDMFFFNDCTGEMNLPLRLRSVRFYTFTQWINLFVCLLDYEMMYGRDKSAPTPAVCSLILRNE